MYYSCQRADDVREALGCFIEAHLDMQGEGEKGFLLAQKGCWRDQCALNSPPSAAFWQMM